ncbi:MAG TPA: ATP-dependent DNA ligase [Pirellulales bacterium]|nr:ATP-dependent DNA ligase [Pirellulales bacterium]
MRRFTKLFYELDATTRTLEKVRALESYFAAAEPADAAWALFFLTGRRIKRAITTRLLRAWIAQAARIPLWLVEECYDAVGDLSETLALLLPDVEEPNASGFAENSLGNGQGTNLPLHRLVEERVLPIRTHDTAGQHDLVVRTWHELNAAQRLVWHKLILGELRIGVARTLVVRALSAVANVAVAEMAHRVMGNWEPTSADYQRLIGGEGHATPGRPYPFFLAHPLESPLSDLGDADEWQVEWKWDGIRAQLLRRQGEVLIWSRGEELLTDRFPEVLEIGRLLPDGTVLDGEILAWRDGRPLSFAVLQRRIGRKTVSAQLCAAAPVAFMAYDLLESSGEDIRCRPLFERRRCLEELASRLPPHERFQLSSIVEFDGWDALAALHSEARSRSVEGLMLKRRSAPYGVGRPKGVWWKWKSQSLTIDAVLIYAQRGHGRRAGLYTDYTFGVWNDAVLVPIAKAYSGLTDEEIREVDRFVRQHTLDKFGPVRVVEPRLVFELHFEGVQISNRHKAGLAVRFPRMARWRHDKPARDADSLDTLRSLARQTATSLAPPQHADPQLRLLP